MTRPLFLGLAVIVTVSTLTLIGCGGSPMSPSKPETHESDNMPKCVSIGLAIDLSKSGKTFQVPPLNPKSDLAVFIDAIIENGCGQLAVTNISSFCDIPPAILVIEKGKKPLPPTEPKLEHYGNEQQYYLARNVYKQELFPEYQAKLVAYEKYCSRQLAAFWPEVERVLGINIDSMWSDYHTAINRLHIAHASAHPAISNICTILYGDGIADTPTPVPLLDTSGNTATFYWVHGTANPTLTNQKWITTYKPISVSTLNSLYQSIFNPQNP